MLLASVTCGRMTGNLSDDFHGLTKEDGYEAVVSGVPLKVVRSLKRRTLPPGVRNAIGCPPVPVRETCSLLGKTIKMASSSQKQVGTSDGSRCAEAVFQLVQ